MSDHSLYKCDFSEFDSCKMGEFFVKAPEREFLNNSCSICLLPSSIISIHLYGFTSISLVVKALVDFCGMTIGFSSSSMLT